MDSLVESITKYEAITGETVEVSPDMAVKIIGNEFMVWKLGIYKDIPFFWIAQMYGNMINFRDFIREVCKAADITIIATATTRNPKAHMRKWKMKRVPECDYTFEGRFYYVLEGHIDNLR